MLCAFKTIVETAPPRVHEAKEMDTRLFKRCVHAPVDEYRRRLKTVRAATGPDHPSCRSLAPATPLRATQQADPAAVERLRADATRLLADVLTFYASWTLELADHATAAPVAARARACEDYIIYANLVHAGDVGPCTVSLATILQIVRRLTLPPSRYSKTPISVFRPTSLHSSVPPRSGHERAAVGQCPHGGDLLQRGAPVDAAAGKAVQSAGHDRGERAGPSQRPLLVPAQVATPPPAHSWHSPHLIDETQPVGVLLALWGGSPCPASRWCSRSMPRRAC